MAGALISWPLWSRRVVIGVNAMVVLRGLHGIKGSWMGLSLHAIVCVVERDLHVVEVAKGFHAIV